VLLTGTSDAEATALADVLRERLGRPFVLSGKEFRVRASIGVTVADLTGPVSEQLHAADVALYAAKSLGKGRIIWFSELGCRPLHSPPESRTVPAGTVIATRPAGGPDPADRRSRHRGAHPLPGPDVAAVARTDLQSRTDLQYGQPPDRAG
jgi:hypothetical protein